MYKKSYMIGEYGEKTYAPAIILSIIMMALMVLASNAFGTLQSNKMERALEAERYEEAIKAGPPDPSSLTLIERYNITEEDIDLLAKNIYFEARNQSISGQYAVGHVTLNRLKDERFPDNLSEVIIQRSQFSWYWDGKSDTPTEIKAWELAKVLAYNLLTKDIKDVTHGSTHYHADYVAPRWSKSTKKKLIKVIGNHIFYKWKPTNKKVPGSLIAIASQFSIPVLV